MPSCRAVAVAVSRPVVRRRPAKVVPGRNAITRVERSGVTRARSRAGAASEKRIDTPAVRPRRVTLVGIEPTTRSVGGGGAGRAVAGGATGVATVGVPPAGSTVVGGGDVPADGVAGGVSAGGVSAGGVPTVIAWVAAVFPTETAATVAAPLWVSR